MLKTNKDRVVKCSVVGKIRVTCCSGWKITQKGKPVVVPGIGGISYNVKLGDSVFGWAGDHIEAGVSVYNPDKSESDSMNILACIGNEVKVMDGDGKGHIGYVVGKHGGAEDVMVHFNEETLELLCPGDKILIKSYGQGLILEDYPEIFAQCIDPNLLLKLDIQENKDGTITVPVVAKIPPYLMGSGTGANNPYRGDYDIMTHDVARNKEFGVDKLKFGDLVLLEDCDNVYGRGYLQGATAVGIVIHSDCMLAGHGPGIATILSSQKNLIKGEITEKANLKNFLDIIPKLEKK